MGRRLPEEEGGGVTAMTALLPTEFADLEPFAGLVPADRARSGYAKRWPARWPTCRRSTTPSRRVPRRRSPICDKFTLDDLPEDVST